ncbi:MAG TPA: acyl-CoA dehydrogenase family protein [Methylomirabilota bacterium]|nr:acyl-CoA dehydrogenase family protein [Methylomirabilota bacterium]
MSAPAGDLRSLLGDTVTRLFGDLVTKEALESAEKGTWPEVLWQALEEGGLTLPLVPEARGGAGGTWLDAHVVVRAAGRHAAPVPLAETIVASWLLATAGLDVPLGPLTIAPAQPDDRVRLRRAGGGWRLEGVAGRVPWGAAAGQVVVVAEADAGPVVALVARDAGRVTPDRNLALEPRDTLTYADAPVLAAAPLASAGAMTAGETVALYGALVRSAQMAGALESLLQQSVRYATERRQFGRPIGNFQAIQHGLAVLAGHAAASGIAAERAFAAAERGDCAFEVAAAKIRCGEAAGVCASIAHQTHGAIGFTYEHSLHFATRRLWSWRAEFGSESRWASALGRRVIARGADALWADLTAR